MVYRYNVNPNELTIVKKNFKVTYKNPVTLFIGDYILKVKDYRGCCMFDKRFYDVFVGENITVIHE